VVKYKLNDAYTCHGNGSNNAAYAGYAIESGLPDIDSRTDDVKNTNLEGISDGAEAQNRTGDTLIFSQVLYQLSYLGEQLYFTRVCH
jgi:hypothetical protein